ncbi:hypothetical protein ES703_04543 [subsurface metagenome]
MSIFIYNIQVNLRIFLIKEKRSGIDPIKDEECVDNGKPGLDI